VIEPDKILNQRALLRQIILHPWLQLLVPIIYKKRCKMRRRNAGHGDVVQRWTHLMRRAAVEDEESAAEVICEGNSWRRPRKRRAQRRRRAAAAAEKAATSRGDWGVKSMQGVRTGNAARCLEVGLVCAWKSDGTGPENLAKQASKDVR